MPGPDWVWKQIAAENWKKRKATFTAPVCSAWQPDAEEEKFVACVGRMALDALAGNGVMNRAAFVANLHGLARCLEKLDTPNGKLSQPAGGEDVN